jgi:pimeloyl-ACP methyl ester carboxylesterase
MHRLDRWYTALARRLPWLMRLTFAPLGWCAKHTPHLFLALLRSASAPPDRAALGDRRLAAHLRLSEVEAFRRGGAAAAQEALLAYRDWGFDIADVYVPTHLWLGGQDIYVSPTMGRHLQERIPDVDVHWLPAAGHFAIHAWDDILAVCRTHV